MKSTKTINYNGIFYNNSKDQLHREDGPAVEWYDGGKVWWLNGKTHREDGPAIEHAGGGKEWWVNDKRHRIDGPAVHFGDHKEWWLNGVEHSKEEYDKRVELINITRKGIKQSGINLDI